MVLKEKKQGGAGWFGKKGGLFIRVRIAKYEESDMDQNDYSDYADQVDWDNDIDKDYDDLFLEWVDEEPQDNKAKKKKKRKTKNKKNKEEKALDHNGGLSAQ